jgi:hypothetical protein
MRLGICLGLILLPFWSPARASGSDSNSPTITILVYHQEWLSPETLAVSEQQAAMILRKAGLETRWVECSAGIKKTDDACRQLDVPTQFVVRIVRRWFGATDTVFGVAFLDQDGRGKSSDVFWDRCEGMHRDTGVNAATLLGTVAAHELGHLLLGSNAHSAIGIMAPHWEQHELQHAAMGSLLFTREQSVRMRARIRSLQSREEEIRLVSRSGCW